MVSRFFRSVAFVAVLAVSVSAFASSKGGSSRSSGMSGTGSKGASTSVRGHTTKSGTYVAPHHRTTPDKTQMNNYGTKGNFNPHNGKTGTKIPTR